MCSYKGTVNLSSDSWKKNKRGKYITYNNFSSLFFLKKLITDLFNLGINYYAILNKKYILFSILYWIIGDCSIDIVLILSFFCLKIIVIFLSFFWNYLLILFWLIWLEPQETNTKLVVASYWIFQRRGKKFHAVPNLLNYIAG